MSAITAPLLTVELRQPTFAFLVSVDFRRRFPIFPRSHSTGSVLRDSYRGLESLRASKNGPITESSTVTVENDEESNLTTFVVRTRNRIGLLRASASVFKVLGVRIERAIVEFEGEIFVKKFFVTDSNGNKIEDGEDLDQIEKALLEEIGGGGAAVSGSTRGVVVRRGGFVGDVVGDKRAKVGRMFELMNVFLKNDSISLEKDILDHVECTVARLRFNFDDFEAYQVTRAYFTLY